MKINCSQYDIFPVSSFTFKAINYSCSWTNILMACPTTVLNILLIIALATSRDRTKPCNILLLNLAVTDLLTGLISMPVFFTIFRFIAESRGSCLLIKISTPFFMFMAYESLTTVALVALERYISIFHPFFHTSKFTFRNITACLGTSWTVSMLLVVPLLFGIRSTNLNWCYVVFAFLTISPTIFCYLRILMRARKVRVQIRVEEARFGHATLNSTDKRYITIGVLIVLSMIICYVPELVTSALRFFESTTEASDNARCWEWTLPMANSFMNPIITCSFCPAIRRNILKVLTCRG